jgi:succinate-semialdehyde dehydrogenase / glutarate-semialdehyde dehydrogenase
MESVNPTHGNVVASYPEHSLLDALTMLGNASTAFESWRSLPFTARGDLFRELARLLRSEKRFLAELAVTEMGKLIGEAEAEVEKSAWVCEHFADHGQAMLAPEDVATEAAHSYVAFEPLGTVLAIMPWNFPYFQVVRFAAPALMAGNVCLLKHAPNVSGCALALHGLFRKAGFPEGVFQAALLPVESVETLIADERIHAVTFTGSVAAGSKVAEGAGRHLKKTVMELGGSDPFLVLEDAPLEECCQAAVRARMINSGQSCIAAKRFIVVREVAQAFEARFAELLRELPVGDPMDPATRVGPLARLDLLEVLDSQVRDSVGKGARLVTGGRRLDRPGFYYAPTLLADVTQGLPVFGEETFGPVAALITVADEEEAVAVVNRSRYGLGASVWSGNPERGEGIARRLEAGVVFVNAAPRSDPRLPFGGVKCSGWGRELSTYGIKEFVNIKTVWVA